MSRPKIDWVTACRALGGHLVPVHTTMRWFASESFSKPRPTMTHFFDTPEEAAEAWIRMMALTFEALAFRMTDA